MADLCAIRIQRTDAAMSKESAIWRHARPEIESRSVTGAGLRPARKYPFGRITKPQ
jgi:hypothetical protein